MTDEAKALVEALKRDTLTYDQRWKLVGLVETQAREIERLTTILSELNDTDVIARTMAENERLREALAHYAAWGVVCPLTDDAIRDDGGDIARAALGDSHDQ